MGKLVGAGIAPCRVQDATGGGVQLDHATPQAISGLQIPDSCVYKQSVAGCKPGAVTGGPQRVCMTVRKKGSHMESWRELAEDWGTLGQ